MAKIPISISSVSIFRILFRFQKIVGVISVCPSPFIDTVTCCNGSLWRWYERGRYRGVSPFSYFSLFSLLPSFLSVYPRPYSPFSPFLPSPSSLSAVSPPLLPLSRPPAPPSETYSLPAKERFRPVHRGERGCNRLANYFKHDSAEWCYLILESHNRDFPRFCASYPVCNPAIIMSMVHQLVEGFQEE